MIFQQWKVRSPKSILPVQVASSVGEITPASSPANATGGGDYDSQYRPQQRTARVRTPWDLGADELPGVPVTLTPPLQ